MRRLLIGFSCLILSACASVPEFRSGWLDHLPMRRIELAAFVYPLDEARPFARMFPAPIQPSDAARVEAVVNRRLTESLRARGFEVGSTLLALRSDHVWLWDWRKGPGSGPAVDKLFADASPTHAQRVDTYSAGLRDRLRSHAGSTVLLVCVAAHLNNRDGSIEYRLPVYMHFGGAEGVWTERCGSTAAIVAVDDQLRLISYSPLYTGHGVEITGRSANPLSSAFTFRQLTPEEWGEMMAKAILERIKATP